MPGGSGARAIWIQDKDDITHYNVTINNQKFERLTPGASVESSPITVGAEVRVTVEAIGNIKNPNNANYFETDRRVAYFETTRTMENGGINISVKMKDYITKYCLINFGVEEREPSQDFTNIEKWVWSDYAEIGKPYKLPNYGVYRPVEEFEAPKKHTGWKYGPNNDKFVAAGGSVIVTEDMENTPFTLVAEEFVRIDFRDGTNCFGYREQNEDWKDTDYVELGGTYKLPSFGIGSFDTFAARHIGWQIVDEDGYVLSTYSKGQVVRITEDMIDPDAQAVMFLLTAENAVELSIIGVDPDNIVVPADGSIYERNDNPDDPYSISYYFIWPNKPFTLPRAKEDENKWVDEWEITGSSIHKTAGATVTYAEWSSVVSGGQLLEIRPYSN